MAIQCSVEIRYHYGAQLPRTGHSKERTYLRKRQMRGLLQIADIHAQERPAFQTFAIWMEQRICFTLATSVYAQYFGVI